MNERIMQWKGATTAVLLVLLLSIAGLTKAQTENITFADATVKAYCVANWDTNGDGELSYDEAAAVTSLDGVFMFDGDITSFDELQFFTGLTSFGEDEFNSCTNLAAITIPSAVTSIGNYAFSDCSSLVLITSYACAPPALGSNVFDNVPSAVVLNVPCHTAALYQAADGWSDFSNYEEFEYGLCPIIFADDNVKAICVAHWDTNGDGELSYAEAAAVTNLGIYFKSTSITSFDELEYFTCLTTIPNTAFYGCTSLASIALPSSVSALGNGSFYNCTSLATMTVYAETPPTVGTNAFKNVPTTMVVHVPCGTYEAYHTASGWNEFTIIQQSGSCPIVFADANVKALCVANWDTNGDGELSYDEAAAVTDLGQVFKNNHSITSFDELHYFINLTSIGGYAFRYCTGLTSIAISNSVSSIGYGAFENCTSLTMVEVPNSVISISNYAFYNCGLTLIEIPNSVISIGTCAFSYCVGLEQITVDSGNTIYDSRENCNAIIKTNNNELVTGCKNTVIPNSVTSIGNYAFYCCTSLTSIEIPNSVTSIGNSAFYGCDYLTSMTILAYNTPTLGSNTFNYVNMGIPVYVPCNAVEDYQTASGWNSFTNILGLCSGEVSVTINPSESGMVTGTGYYTGGDVCVLTAMPNPGFSFGNWTENGTVVSLDSVYSFYAHPTTLVANFYSNIPITFADANVKALCVTNWDTNGDGELSFAEAAAVTDLGEVFENKSSITSFNEFQYFYSLSYIGDYAFSRCTGLSSIEIPNSVITIGGHAFSECTGLTSVELPNSVITIGGYAFYGCNSLTSIAIPNSVSLIGVRAFLDCYSLEQIIVDSGNTVYDSRENCDAIIKTSTNELVTGCKNTVIPNSVTSIGNEAFYNCSDLTSIEIPNSVTLIDDYAFYNCTSLTSVSFGDSVTIINKHAFAFCSGLSGTLTLPSSVTSIGEYAFNRCRGLTSITSLAETPPALGTSVFYYVSNAIPVHVPCGTVDDYQIANGWSDFSNVIGLCSGEVSVTINPSESGMVTGTGYYTGGDVCVLTAMPNPGFGFGNWTENGTIVSSDSVYSFYAHPTTLVANFYSNNPITFADTNVKALCVANWDTNGDGELSFAEAAAVTDLGEVFKNKSSITSFNEFQYFYSVSLIGDYAFGYCSGLTSIEIPSSVTYIGKWAFISCNGMTSIKLPDSVIEIDYCAFAGCSSLSSMAVLSEVPPSLDSYVFNNVNKSIPVYVPCDALEAYQGANSWSEFTNIIGMCPGTITVAVSPTEGGTVTGGGSYEGGATCTLTTTANHDYRFLNWTENGEVVSSEADYTFTVTGDRNLVANFIAMPPMPVVAEYYPDPNEPNSPYVKVHWAASSFEAMIGDEVSSAYTAYMPFYTLYDNSISEALYTASELSEAGVTAGPITSLSWEAVSVTTNQPQNNISIWMANVSDTELTTTSHLASNMTLVYTGNIGIPPLGWNEFVFNESNFVWDGTSNVLILCQRNNGQWNGSVYWRSHNPGFYGMAYKYRDGTPYDVTSQTYALTLSNTVRPNIIMKGEGSMTYNLYRANCDGTDAQLIAENLNDTQYIDETWWQLENNSYKYGVSVADSTNTDIFWSNCIDKPKAFHFITAGNWSEPSNWQENILPNQNDIVFIDASCQLDINVEVTDLTITTNQSLTLQSGKTLTVTDTLTNSAVSGLIIEDSAQLIHNNAGVQATVKKTIAGYGTSEDKWYFITNPITDSIIPSSGNGLLSSNYDLYYCFPTSADRLEWRNYKSGAFALHNGEGYLYANETGTELSFGGTLAPSNSNVMRTVSYEVGNNSPGNGWTFLGNPFACNCYLVDANGNPLTIYKMNATGTDLEAVESGPIAPMEGFFYYTTETRNVYFSRTVPVGLSK